MLGTPRELHGLMSGISSSYLGIQDTGELFFLTDVSLLYEPHRHQGLRKHPGMVVCSQNIKSARANFAYCFLGSWVGTQAFGDTSVEPYDIKGLLNILEK